MTTDAIVQRLSTNVWFGCLTRPALEMALESANLSGMTIVYLDIDNLKEANNRWGKNESSRRIRESLRVRSADVIFGNWFSGDEFLALVPAEDAAGFAARIQEALISNGMSATFVILDPSRIDEADGFVTQAKLCSKGSIWRVDAGSLQRI